MIHIVAKHWDFVGMLAVTCLLFGAYGLILCKTAARPTPKPPKANEFECDGDCLHSGRGLHMDD